MELKHFRIQDFNCPCCGKNEMNLDFLAALDIARGIARIPFLITSGYRCPDHDLAIGGKGNHTTGKAADIRCNNSSDRFRIVQGLIGAGFHRIEVAPLHVHVDEVDGKSAALWIGTST